MFNVFSSFSILFGWIAGQKRPPKVHFERYISHRSLAFKQGAWMPSPATVDQFLRQLALKRLFLVPRTRPTPVLLRATCASYRLGACERKQKPCASCQSEQVSYYIIYKYNMNICIAST